jgi:hypothetical protein
MTIHTQDAFLTVGGMGEILRLIPMARTAERFIGQAKLLRVGLVAANTLNSSLGMGGLFPLVKSPFMAILAGRGVDGELLDAGLRVIFNISAMAVFTGRPRKTGFRCGLGMRRLLPGIGFTPVALDAGLVS